MAQSFLQNRIPPPIISRDLKFSLWVTMRPPSSVFLPLFRRGRYTTFSYHCSKRLGRGKKKKKKKIVSIFPPLSRYYNGLKRKINQGQSESLRLLVGMDCIYSISMDDWTLPQYHCVWYSNWCYHFLCDDWKLPQYHYVWYSNWCYHFLGLHGEKTDELLVTSNL